MEAANLVHGVTTFEDETNFARCVEPLSSQKELEPNQITLFQSLYQQDPFTKKHSAFAGAQAARQFSMLGTALIGLPE